MALQHMLPISTHVVNIHENLDLKKYLDKSEEAKFAEGARSEKMAGTNRQLAVCFLGIFVSYLVYGILQENITKSRYGEGGERFTYMSAMVLVQCIINALFAQAAIKFTNAGVDTSPQKMFAIMSFSYLGAMLCSNHALAYVSYPTQVIGKSIKPIPVMVLGVILARKRYPLVKYLFVMLIVVGIVLFMYKPKHNEASVNSPEESAPMGWGELLLMISLGLDGVTGGVQDKLRAEYRTQTHRMMLWMNVWSIVYLAIGLTVTGEGVEFILFVLQYPSVLYQLIAFSVCSAIGQHFIFMTINLFGPLTCSIITTTRKFFTILGSVFVFRNPMSWGQWLGTILVFVGLTLDSMYGKEHKKPVDKSDKNNQHKNNHKITER